MKHFIPLLILLFTLDCKRHLDKKKSTPQSNNFAFFEISYRSGGYGGFSLYVDSSKIFFAPSIHPAGGEDSLKFGLLPDSILRTISETVELLKSDSLISSTESNCYDCSLVAIQTVLLKDTIRFFQTGIEINPQVNKLIQILDLFIDSTKHKTINSMMLLATARRVAQPLPPPMRQ